jgi:methyl-accepting chemotaxis protein
MRWNIGNQIAAAFVVSTVIFAAVGVGAYRGLERNTNDEEQVVHTYEVLQAIDGIVRALLDAETGERGFVISGAETFLEPYVRGVADVTAAMDEAKALTAENAKLQKLIDALRPLAVARLAELKEIIAIRRLKGLNASVEAVRSENGRRDMSAIRVLAKEMEAEERNLLQTRRQESESSATRLKVIIALGTLASVLVLVGAGFSLTRSIARPIRAVTAIAERIAEGDLTVQVEAGDRSDEIGSMQRALRTMLHNLRALNQELQSGFSVLASASTEIVATVSQLAASAAEVATAVTETSATTEEVKQTAHLSNQKAKTVLEVSQKAAAVSETGRKAVIETFDGMSGIREQMESIAESVVRLSEQGQAIGGIIATVSDIAAQSNLLAVNAAIEATRAGEYGKGFAVVAQEVRSLAEQSRQATTQVRTILMEVQKATSAAVMATEQGTKAVAAGVKQATDAGEASRELTGGVAEAAQAAIQIAASIQQQLVGMDQIASAIANIRQATSQNIASSRQLEDAAKGMQELGGRLRTLVERQRLEA